VRVSVGVVIRYMILFYFLVNLIFLYNNIKALIQEIFIYYKVNKILKKYYLIFTTIFIFSNFYNNSYIFIYQKIINL